MTTTTTTSTVTEVEAVEVKKTVESEEEPKIISVEEEEEDSKVVKKKKKKKKKSIFTDPAMKKEVAKVREILNLIMDQKRTAYSTEEEFIQDAEDTVQTNQITCLVFHMLKDENAEIGQRLGEVCKDDKELGANLALIYHKYELFCNLLITIEPKIPLAVQILIAYKSFQNEEIDRKMYRIARRSIMRMVEEMERRKAEGTFDEELGFLSVSEDESSEDESSEDESSEDESLGEEDANKDE